MPEFQPVAAEDVTAIRRPGCLKCQQSRMLLAKLEAGPAGFGKGTFECLKCGSVQTLAVSYGTMRLGGAGLAGRRA